MEPFDHFDELRAGRLRVLFSLRSLRCRGARYSLRSKGCKKMKARPENKADFTGMGGKCVFLKFRIKSVRKSLFHDLICL